MTKALLSVLLFGAMTPTTQAAYWVFYSDGYFSGDTQVDVGNAINSVACGANAEADTRCDGLNYIETDGLQCFCSDGGGTIRPSSGGYQIFIKQAPTPSPTPAQAISMSGDPIVGVNGYRVKFDLPSKELTLLWNDGHLQIFARADIVTPDKSSQWFSEFLLETTSWSVSIKPQLGSLPEAMVDGLKTLAVTITDHQKRETSFAHLGQVFMDKGLMNFTVVKDNHMIGLHQREMVNVKSSKFACQITPEVAKKFLNVDKALKYVHLDIAITKMFGATSGIFAELFGFVPMTARTARKIRSSKPLAE